MSAPDPTVAPTRLSRLRALGIGAPHPRLGFAWPRTPTHGLRRVLPLRRWSVGMLVAAALLAVMCIPLFAVGLPRMHAERGLVAVSMSLFQWFWLLGWAVGAAMPGLALAVLLLAREVLTAQPGLLQLRLEVLGFGLGAAYPAAEVRNLRCACGNVAPGTAWRGDHLVFDFHGVPVQFGSDLDATTAAELRFDVQQVLATAPTSDFVMPSAIPSPTLGSQVDTPPLEASPPSPAASRIALLGLVAANLLPLVGVLRLGWKVGDIMLVYWAESVIIGLINIAKLVIVGRWAAIFYAPFFVGHYGAFMAGHLMFVYMMFVRGAEHLDHIAMAEVTATLLSLWPALLGLTASHLLSFFQNFIGRREYTRSKVSDQMNAPYKRVLVMQVTIIIGGMLTLALGSSLPALLLLIVLKTLIDVNAHRGERQRVDG